MFKVLAAKLKSLFEIVRRTVEKVKEYISPRNLFKQNDFKESLPPIIIYNRSAHARNMAITQLRDAFGDALPIIEVVPKGNRPIEQRRHKLSNYVIQVDNNKASFKTPQAIKDLYMAQIKNKLPQNNFRETPLMYNVWCAEAEDPEMADKTTDSGCLWVGASAESMRTLGTKIAYKNFCKTNSVKTAEFFELNTDTYDKTNVDDMALNDYLDKLTENLVSKYFKNDYFTGSELKNFFIKSSFGGGGRGTEKVVAPTDRSLDAIDKFKATVRAKLARVISDTSSRHEIYVEEALDLDGATLMQLELEVDGDQVEKGGRLVWFNTKNQKVLEIGLSDALIAGIIGEEVYNQCVEETQRLAQKAGYNSRGTNEILLVRHRDGSIDHYGSEFNCRIQVEHQALSYLKKDSTGKEKNVPAEQVMRALGFKAPISHEGESGDVPEFQLDPERGIVAHIRLVNASPAVDKAWTFSGGDVVDINNVPEGVDVELCKGKINAAADPQIGRLLVYAKDWKEMCQKLDAVGDINIIGVDGPMCTSYLAFLKRLANDDAFKGVELGCNQTSKVLDNEKVDASETSTTVRKLTNVSKYILNGYRTGSKQVDDAPFPIREQSNAYHDMMATLNSRPIPTEKTAHQNFVESGDLDTYYTQLNAQLEAQGGGMNAVYPRDSKQEGGMSQSAVIEEAYHKVMEHFGSQFLIGNETGGAQWEVANMDGIGALPFFLKSFDARWPNRSLTRSEWLNSLESKSPEDQDFIIGQYAKMLREKMALPEGQFLPWFPNNFHAGNHPDQDITAGLFLKHGFTPVPNWCWDPRFKDDESALKNWVKRQHNLFKDKAYAFNGEPRGPIRELRIKNPGQQPEWTAEEIWRNVKVILDECAKFQDEVPIIHIHNHNIDGLAGEIARKTLLLAQENRYRKLVFDTAPPNTTHNNVQVVASALTLTTEQKSAIDSYSQHTATIDNMCQRFDVREIVRNVTPVYSKWAMGTGSSDYDSAKAKGLNEQEMEAAKLLSWHIFGLGVVVTPFSEVLKRLGYEIWKVNAIDSILKTNFAEVLYNFNQELKKALKIESEDQRNNAITSIKQRFEPQIERAFTPLKEACEKYITEGGTLKVGKSTLSILTEWKTLLSKPRIVDTLLFNYLVIKNSDEAIARDIFKEVFAPIGNESRMEKAIVYELYNWPSLAKEKKAIQNALKAKDAEKIEAAKTRFIEKAIEKCANETFLSPLTLNYIEDLNETIKENDRFKTVIETYKRSLTESKATDINRLRTELKRKYPNVNITDDIVAMIMAYGSSGHKYLEKLNSNQDLSDLIDQPHLLLEAPDDLLAKVKPIEAEQAQTAKETVRVNLNGKTYQLVNFVRDPKTAICTFTYQNTEDRSENFETLAIDVNLAIEIERIIPPEIVGLKDKDKAIGSEGPGTITKINVHSGHIITEANCGDDPEEPIGGIEICKEEQPIRISRDLIGKRITDIKVQEGDEIDVANQWLMSFADAAAEDSE